MNKDLIDAIYKEGYRINEKHDFIDVNKLFEMLMDYTINKKIMGNLSAGFAHPEHLSMERLNSFAFEYDIYGF